MLFGVALLSGCASPCRRFSFQEISPGIFLGCRPKTQSDFDAIRTHGIGTIISFEAFTWHVEPERRMAERNGLGFRNAPIPATPLQPSEREVKEALLVLSDKSLRPVYIHCLYGRDRTLFIFALYQIYYRGVSAQDAWNAMLAHGFKRYWSLRGFEKYFWRHTTKPDWAIP